MVQSAGRSLLWQQQVRALARSSSTLMWQPSCQIDFRPKETDFLRGDPLREEANATSHQF